MRNRITVIVPCFNQGEYLNNCLQSVFNQSYSNWECIIVNDGGHDETESVADFWVKKDSRFKYVFQENKGLPAARNTGITNATGTFILPLDADDKIAEKYIELGIKAFQQNANVRLIYCKAVKFGQERGVLDLKKFSLRELALNNMIFCSAIYMKKDWRSIGGYDEVLTKGWEDWDFWISLLKNGGEVKKLNYIGFFYRIKPSSMLKSMDKDGEKKIYEYLSAKHHRFYIEQFGSFPYLINKIQDLKKENNKFRSMGKKYVIDLFLKRFFGFQIFSSISLKNDL